MAPMLACKPRGRMPAARHRHAQASGEMLVLEVTCNTLIRKLAGVPYVGCLGNARLHVYKSSNSSSLCL
jgi:hypothetical protein